MKTYTEMEASKFLRKGRNFLRDRRINNKACPPFEKIGVKRYYKESDLKEFKATLDYVPEGLYSEQSASVYLGHDMGYLSFRRCEGRSLPPCTEHNGRRYYKLEDLKKWQKDRDK